MLTAIIIIYKSETVLIFNFFKINDLSKQKKKLFEQYRLKWSQKINLENIQHTLQKSTYQNGQLSFKFC